MATVKCMVHEKGVSLECFHTSEMVCRDETVEEFLTREKKVWVELRAQCDELAAQGEHSINIHAIM